MTKRLSLLFAAASLALFALNATATKITIVNVDGPGEGFNDPTPTKPVGKNTGRTLGQQRLNAFQFAADTWAATIDSNVEIRIQASFDPLACDATSAVLGSAGTIQIVSDFPGAPVANTWYPIALANKLAGQDLIPGDPGTSADDIRARFNSNIGQPNCLTSSGWYYGLDAKHGQLIDLVTVLLHEFAHGLGFASFVDETKGSEIRGQTDVYSMHLLDLTTGKTWDQMTNAERKASAINVRNLVWNGGQVTADSVAVLTLGTPFMKVNAPAGIAGNYDVGTASFGPALTAAGVTGSVMLANDGAGTVTDACEAIPAGSLSGNIALVDRGTCTFVTKALNVQAAGAIGMVVADNVAGSPPGDMSGTDSSITISSVRITLDAGNTLKSQLAAGVNVTLLLDTTIRAGTRAGKVLVYTPNPVDPGSSVSHWDTIAFPNQLMEPFINSDLTHDVTTPADLTFSLFKDIGW
jgi:hypothetical protein